MSEPASRVIGIIRISEPHDEHLDVFVTTDDSTLGALLAGLAGRRLPPLPGAQRGRWAPLATQRRKGTRQVMRANLPALRDELDREYLALAAG